MESFEAGTLAGAGSFRCEECGFAVGLRERDQVPACPSCGGRSYRRAPMFADASPAEPPHADPSEPDWLPEARDALTSAGEYLAFDAGQGVQVVALDGGWTRVGRSLAAHVRLDDPTVSRRHALIHREEDGRCTVLDDRSLNGVFKNGESLDLADLDDGDAISVGRFTLHFISLREGDGRDEPAPAANALG